MDYKKSSLFILWQFQIIMDCIMDYSEHQFYGYYNSIVMWVAFSNPWLLFADSLIWVNLINKSARLSFSMILSFSSKFALVYHETTCRAKLVSPCHMLNRASKIFNWGHKEVSRDSFVNRAKFIAEAIPFEWIYFNKNCLWFMRQNFTSIKFSIILSHCKQNLVYCSHHLCQLLISCDNQNA